MLPDEPSAHAAGNGNDDDRVEAAGPDPRSLHERAGLSAPDQVARDALARARSAARARGLRPGVPRKPLAEDGTDRAGRGRDPQLVGDVVAHLLRTRGWVQDVSVGGVVGRWREIVGDQVADHCAPETFEDKVLVVRADSSAWATQVRLLAPRLLDAVAREVGDGVVTEVRVLGPAGRSFRRGPRSVPGRGARDTWG